MTKSYSYALVALFCCLFSATTARAEAGAGDSDRGASTPSAEGGVPNHEDSNGPVLTYGGEVNTHLQGEITKPQGTQPKAGVYDDTDLSLWSNYSSWLSLDSDIKLERQRNDNLNDYYPDRNTFFRSEGVTLRQLYATVRPVESVAIYAGKIHPNFGSAYENTPGIFYNFGTDYEQDERIGFGAQYRLPDFSVFQNLRFSIETYYLDTSYLSQSILSRPSLDDPNADRAYRYARNQFGPSNTGGFDSFTAALRGGRAERGLTYQVSFTQEATDDPAGKTEYGESVSASYDPSGDGIPLTANWGVTPFLEYTHFNNFQGIADLDRHYVVGGLGFAHGRWNLSLAGGLRQSEGVSQDTDVQENVSLTYELFEHFEIGGGVNHANIAHQGSWTVGPSLSYTLAF